MASFCSRHHFSVAVSARAIVVADHLVFDDAENVDYGLNAYCCFIISLRASIGVYRATCPGNGGNLGKGGDFKPITYSNEISHCAPAPPPAPIVIWR
jgi:hypothetical protein